MAEKDIGDFMVTQEHVCHYGRDFENTMYRVLETDGLPGLIKCALCRYKPTYPMDRIAVEMARLISGDRYQAEATICAELPPVWLTGIDDTALKQAVGDVVAGASIHGDIRPEISPERMSQFLMLFLVETGSESSAEVLERIAQAKRAQKNDYSMLAISRGRLFCLLVARCMYEGKTAIETSDTLMRFAPALAAILQYGGVDAA
jgi:hypothetical protein